MVPLKQLDSSTPQDMWIRFTSGDDEAFAWLYNSYVQLLYNYGMTLLGNHELVEDGIQELFLKLYQKRNDLKDPMDIQSYLIVSLRNTLYTLLKQKGRDRIESVTEDAILQTETVEELYIDMERVRLKQEYVTHLLNDLPLRQREIIYYRYIQELPLDKICEMMNLNYQSAQNLLQRSMKKLKGLYKRTTILIFILFEFI